MTIRSELYISYALGFLVALIIFSTVLVAMGFSPLTSFEAIAYGSFGSVFSATETFVRFSPLLLTALAFLIGFKARFFNIGAEGQMYIGALAAYLAASNLNVLPSILSIPLVVLAAFLSGAGWIAIPLVMRIKLEVNEMFPTVVLNFIAIFIISWLTTGPIKDPSAVNPQTVTIPPATWLPVLVSGTRLHTGVILSLLLAILIFVILYRTVLGYEIRAVGLNLRAAKHGGINTARSITAVGVLSGGLAGIAGMVEVAGAHHLLIQGFSPGFGYQGIGIAALGGFHPIGALLASLLFSVLLIGGETMQRGAGVPIEMVFILQAVLVLSVLIVQKWVSSRR